MYSGSYIKLNNQAVGTSMYQFPKIWEIITYIASYFNLLLGMLLITLITDEYSFRTIRQQVIDGLFRSDIILNKFWVVLFMAAISTCYLLILGLGFGLVYATPTGTSNIFSGAMHLVYYLVQALGYMSMAVFMAFLIRKNGLAIISFLVYTKIAEPLIHWQTEDTIDQYFPMKVLTSLTPMPGQEVLDSVTGPTMDLSPQQAIFPALFYILLLYLLSYALLKIRDL